MKKQHIEALFQLFKENNPHPKTELLFKNNFQLLISVMLSAQATDISVNKVTPLLFKNAPNPEAMVKLGIDGIKDYIKTIGLYNSKAKNIYHCCALLKEHYQSAIPSTRKELEALPGVGKKTAGVVMNVAFGALVIPVDTHILRVSNRLGLIRSKTPDETEAKLTKIIPPWAIKDAHNWLILHGRYICKARKPACHQCQLVSFCQFKDKNL